MPADPIRGKTVRWTYQDGPVAGKTFEHTFAADGTVTFREIDPKQRGDGSTAETKVRYEFASVNDDVCAVSYLSKSGYTLTSVLDSKAGTIVSFASNEKELVTQQGTFIVVGEAAPGPR